jgi:uncharacterized protein YyaL (SSP411 family)
MAAFDGKGGFYNIAARTLSKNLGQISQYPGAFANWLSAYQHILRPLKEIAIMGKAEEPALTSMKDLIWSNFRPGIILAVGEENQGDAPILLNDRTRLNEQATAYVCLLHTCQTPVTTLEDLSKLL